MVVGNNNTYSFQDILNDIPNQIQMEVTQFQVPSANHTYTGDLVQLKEEFDKLEDVDATQINWLINTLDDIAPPKPINQPITFPEKSTLVETINGHIIDIPKQTEDIIQSAIELCQNYGIKSSELNAAISALNDIYEVTPLTKLKLEDGYAYGKNQNEQSLQTIPDFASREQETEFSAENGFQIKNYNTSHRTNFIGTNLDNFEARLNRKELNK